MMSAPSATSRCYPPLSKYAGQPLDLQQREGRTYEGTAREAFGTWRKLIAFAVAERGGASRSVSDGQRHSTQERRQLGEGEQFT